MDATTHLEYGAITSEIVAVHLEREIAIDAAQPSPLWEQACPITFCSDWRGENPEPARQTQVRTLWSDETLYVRFACRYRELFLFTDSEPNGRRDQLWDRDVAEVFLQPSLSLAENYKEFEISPNGMWIDLDVSQCGIADLKSDLKCSSFLDRERHIWSAELAIPIKALTIQFDPSATWGVNFFRIEGAEEPRAYHAWKPTMTAEPDFHVPEAFGELRFAAPR
jgi:alpha-galactosidase